MKLQSNLEKITKKPLGECTDKVIYNALLKLANKMAEEKTASNQGKKKKAYYISAEFLIGKLLSNNLINLGIYDDVKNMLAKAGKDIAVIEEMEPEPSLGNGGLGRLAACFLDSMATLGLNSDGIGLNYHYGLFKQQLKKRVQVETKNPWIKKPSWLNDTGVSFDVEFKDFKVTGQMYDIFVTGYQNGTNRLHLFDVESVDESIVKNGIDFDKNEIVKNLTLFLYPDDSDDAGRKLRVYQQYFMVSCGAQLILKEARERGSNLQDLFEYAVIQINDTHPSMVIPELIRLLKIEGIEEMEAIEIVSKTCAYTNHTILAEALEKWPMDYLEEIVPQLVPIIKELNRIVCEKYNDRSVHIIDDENRVHMAHMDIHYGFSVNGVAALHTDILINTELRNFAAIYPGKFNNKTNGITFRRWLVHCNHPLTNLITKEIGKDFIKDATLLKEFEKCADDKKIIKKVLDIKQKNKTALCDYLEQTQKIKMNPDSIFDIQIKRLHEYKRQQMNALYIIYKYLDIKGGNIPKTPITIIFGAKAAPAYIIAKDIIHVILCLSDMIKKDKAVAPHLNVVMVENYNVTLAEKLIPACDVSEQISLASKEASGTGNMKFMLNGAVTLGTMDGANVEIAELVGEDNIYTFGKSSEEVIELYQEGTRYNAKKIMEESPLVTKLVDFIIGKEMMKLGNPEQLERLHNEIVNKDWFMALLDLEEYIKAKEQVFEDYENRSEWGKMTIRNIANAGFFSSDRTIAQYNTDIWKLD